MYIVIIDSLFDEGLKKLIFDRKRRKRMGGSATQKKVR